MTPQQAASLTTDQLRDWCAEDDGWTLTPMGARRQIVHPDPTATYTYTASVPCGPYRWLRDGVVHKDHPHPPTIDGAAAALSEGWTWKRYTDTDDGEVWAAWRTVGEGIWVDEVNVPDTGDELRDRWLLAVLCRLAAKESKHGT